MTAPVTTTHAETVGVSPKAVAATAVSTVLGIVLAVLNLLQEDPSLLGALPPVLQALILAAVPPLLVGFTTYRAAVGAVALRSAEPERF